MLFFDEALRDIAPKKGRGGGGLLHRARHMRRSDQRGRAEFGDLTMTSAHLMFGFGETFYRRGGLIGTLILSMHFNLLRGKVDMYNNK